MWEQATYVLIGAAAGLAGNAVWVSFLIASMVVRLTGVSYMELSSMYPLAGAEYGCAKTAFLYFSCCYCWCST